MVRAGGVSLTQRDDVSVVSFEHRELGDGGKETTVTLANSRLDLVDAPHLQEGKDLEWRFGYPGNLTPTYKSVITVTEPTFDAFGGLTLRLYAYDGVAGALFGQRQKVWRNADTAEITRSEAVELLAAEIGVNVEVEPTKHTLTEIAQNENDWDFLKRLASNAVAADTAHAGAYRVWFDSESQTLHFKSAPFYNKPKHSYSFVTEREDPVLITFSPQINTSRPDASGGDSTNASGMDGSGEDVDETQTGEDAERARGGRYLSLDAPGAYYEWVNEPPGAVKEVLDASDPATEPEVAEDQAGANVAEEELKAIEAIITLIGDPTLRANDIIEIRGVGQKLSGNYLCAEVVHRLGSDGFLTEITGGLGQLPGDADGEGTEAGGSEGGSEDGSATGPDGYTHTVDVDAEDIDSEIDSGGR